MISKNSTRLEQLKALRDILADSINELPGARDLAQLSRQYRETLIEIEEIEGATGDNDEIDELISNRKSGSVR